MVWGKPKDMSRHPGGEDHIRLWPLPCVSATVSRVKATLQGIVAKSLYVMTQKYMESITPVCQFPHRDFNSVQPHYLRTGLSYGCSGPSQWTSLVMMYVHYSSPCLLARSLIFGSSISCQ